MTCLFRVHATLQVFVCISYDLCLVNIQVDRHAYTYSSASWAKNAYKIYFKNWPDSTANPKPIHNKWNKLCLSSVLWLTSRRQSWFEVRYNSRHIQHHYRVYTPTFNPLKCSGIRWLPLQVLSERKETVRLQCAVPASEKFIVQLSAL